MSINAYGTTIVKTLDAVTSAATGESITTGFTRHAFQLLTAKGSTVTLEGSLDGSNWASLGTLSSNAAMLQVQGTFLYVRARITSFTSGDTVTVLYRGLPG